jgi:hypothetical protein
MMDSRFPEMSSERFLRHNAGRAFCQSCLAIHTGLTMQQAAAAVTALGRLSEFAVSLAPCLSCGRTNPLISATAA